MWTNVTCLESTDTNVRKYVFTHPTAVAEAVLYKHPTYQARTVICCSTQSGCSIGCRFCGSGDHFVRNLSAEEICDQPVRLLNDTGVDSDQVENLQIMFMSMGEPMLNMAALNEAIRRLHRSYPNAALLVSTVAPQVSYQPFLDLSCAVPTVGLQFSVHESTDEARNRLIPFKAKLSLAEIANLGNRWHYLTERPPFFNYCVHSGNNTETDADRLVALFDPSWWHATLSVICERGEHVAAANERQRALAADFSTLMLARGFSTRVFNPGGQDDVGGGCGQLWHVQKWMGEHPDQARPSVGYGQPAIHTPVFGLANTVSE